MLKDLRCQRLAPHRVRKEKAVSSFLDTIAVLIIFSPLLVGATVNKAFESSRWRGVATCIAVIAALTVVFTFQACVWRVNNWDYGLKLIVASIDIAMLLFSGEFIAMTPYMTEEDEKKSS
jgi:hypothetical protein